MYFTRLQDPAPVHTILQSVRKVWNQWEFYLLFIICIICSILSRVYVTVDGVLDWQSDLLHTSTN
jgi:hypothetical protein